MRAASTLALKHIVCVVELGGHVHYRVHGRIRGTVALLYRAAGRLEGDRWILSLVLATDVPGRFGGDPAVLG